MARSKDYKAIVARGDPEKPLSEQEFLYVQHRATGLPKSASARLAGYKHAKDVCGDIESRPHVAAALQREAAKYAEVSNVKRRDVIEGIKDAIERAKLAGEPATEISGWREIAKICGHYAPEVKKIELSLDAQKLKSRYEDMSDEDLYEIATGDIIEGESYRVAN